MCMPPGETEGHGLLLSTVEHLLFANRTQPVTGEPLASLAIFPSLSALSPTTSRLHPSLPHHPVLFHISILGLFAFCHCHLRILCRSPRVSSSPVPPFSLRFSPGGFICSSQLAVLALALSPVPRTPLGPSGRRRGSPQDGAAAVLPVEPGPGAVRRAVSVGGASTRPLGPSGAVRRPSPPRRRFPPRRGGARAARGPSPEAGGWGRAPAWRCSARGSAGPAREPGGR